MVEVERCGDAEAPQRTPGGLSQTPETGKYRHGAHLTPPVNAIFTDIAALLSVLKQHLQRADRAFTGENGSLDKI
ncbi:hypothetical protein [Parvibaculum sp.]|jgi:hypothetical protein|uniref:hypothetical protein n=1 Tax=Parvibaculum sp. TaxID=2024848 RepID=UPI001B0BAF6E|nr:hypothetical protein [Parvibaculum sp.]MBO6713352.1 hypothetical protein [Parvibaculum sp.]|tara:strand:- start:12549 stop:12773 length:225 start_codon:yes stop_codon:yes gene_type:complete